MLAKATLARKISEIVRRRGLTQLEVAEVLGLPQLKVSGLLRGQFRGISERKLIDCLTKSWRRAARISGRRGALSSAEHPTARGYSFSGREATRQTGSKEILVLKMLDEEASRHLLF